MKYSAAFKAKMVKRMCGRDAVGAEALSEETGVGKTSLWRWRRDASSVLDVTVKRETAPKRSQDWAAEQKLQAVVETAALNDDELGTYLRRNGLHAETLASWREEALESLRGARPSRQKRSAEQKQIRDLEKNLRRKDKALAETTALLVLKKKFNAVFGDEDNGTTSESDE